VIEQKNIDHLFRHQYGKMVSILTRIFGVQHLQLIEDAVQDTFISALKTWRNGMPENPEAWLTSAAKNRVIDLFRQTDSMNERHRKWTSGTATIALNELFLDTEIKDSQLRMIFAACNPRLKSQDQIAFALKTISGFSAKEIATALLLKEETVKKRLTRARKVIVSENLAFEIPAGADLQVRLERAMEVVYLIFNEGFHSTRSSQLVREDLCGEALRLCKLILSNPLTATADVQALFALCCFHSSRLRSKVDENNEALSLREQDRSLWYQPLIHLGFSVLEKAKQGRPGVYHIEAAIAAEHARAKTYEDTDWEHIIELYQKLNEWNPSPFHLLNLATCHLQLHAFDEASRLLNSIDEDDLEQRRYLYHGLWAEYYRMKGEKSAGIEAIDKALELVSNEAERKFLQKKRQKINAL